MPLTLDREVTKENNLKYEIRIPLLTVCIFKDNNNFCAKCVELDLVTEMDTPNDTLKAMVEMIKEYAQDYESRKDIFSNSPNRYHHLPYIERINKCKDDWELLEQIEVRYGHIYL
ncbi:MAG: hypothetical protein QME42_03220 [bacterium]|nr:hypothetical protein [bacterium]